jgi:hypothetical protein
MLIEEVALENVFEGLADTPIAGITTAQPETPSPSGARKRAMRCV